LSDISAGVGLTLRYQMFAAPADVDSGVVDSEIISLTDRRDEYICIPRRMP
jgi:hypothetical protein